MSLEAVASPESTPDPHPKEEDVVEAASNDTHQYFSTPRNKTNSIALVIDQKEDILGFKSFFTVDCEDVIRQLQQGWSAGKRKMDELDISTITAEPPPFCCTPNSGLDDTISSAKRRRINDTDHNTTVEILLCSTQRKSSPVVRNVLCQSLHRLQVHGKTTSTKRDLFKKAKKGRRSEPSIAFRECTTNGSQSNFPKTSSAKSEKRTISIFGKQTTVTKDKRPSAFLKRLQGHHFEFARQGSPTQPIEFRSFFSAECENIYNQLKSGIRVNVDVSCIEAELPPNLSSNITFMSEVDNSYIKACSGLGVTQLDLEKMNFSHSGADKELLPNTPAKTLYGLKKIGAVERLSVANTPNRRKMMCDLASIADITQDIVAMCNEESDSNTTNTMVVTPKVSKHKLALPMPYKEPIVDTTQDIVIEQCFSAANVTHDMTLDVSLANATQVITPVCDGIEELKATSNVFCIEDAKENDTEKVCGTVGLADTTHDIVMHDKVSVEDTCKVLNAVDSIDLATNKKISVVAECVKSSKTKAGKGSVAYAALCPSNGNTHCTDPVVDPLQSTYIEEVGLNTTNIIARHGDDPLTDAKKDKAIHVPVSQGEVHIAKDLHGLMKVTRSAESKPPIQRGFLALQKKGGLLDKDALRPDGKKALPKWTKPSTIAGKNILTEHPNILKVQDLKSNVTFTNEAQNNTKRTDTLLVHKIPMCMGRPPLNPKGWSLNNQEAQNITHDLTICKTGANPNTQDTFVFNRDTRESKPAKTSGDLQSTSLNPKGWSLKNQSAQNITHDLTICKTEANPNTQDTFVFNRDTGKSNPARTSGDQKGTSLNQKDLSLKNQETKNITHDLTICKTEANPNTQDTFVFNRDAKVSEPARTSGDLKGTLLNPKGWSLKNQEAKNITHDLTICKAEANPNTQDTFVVNGDTGESNPARTSGDLKGTSLNPKDWSLKNQEAKNITHDMTICKAEANPNTQDTLVKRHSEESNPARTSGDLLETVENVEVIAANHTILIAGPPDIQDKKEEGGCNRVAINEVKDHLMNSLCDLDITHITNDESLFSHGPMTFITSTPLPSASSHAFIKKSNITDLRNNPNPSVSKGLEIRRPMATPKAFTSGLPARGVASQIQGPLLQGFRIPRPTKTTPPIEASNLPKPTPGPSMPPPLASSTLLKTPQTVKSVNSVKGQVVPNRGNTNGHTKPATGLPRRNISGVQNSTVNAANAPQQPRSLENKFGASNGSNPRVDQFMTPLSTVSRFARPTPQMSTPINRMRTAKTPNTVSSLQSAARPLKFPVLSTPQAAGPRPGLTFLCTPQPTGSQLTSSRTKACVSGLPVRKLPI